MAFIFKDRSLIPNWRDFKKTVALGELSISLSKQDKRDFSYIEPYITQWQKNHTLAHAGDLISNACVIGMKDNEFVIEAANFVLKSEKPPLSLLSVSTKIVNLIKSDVVNLLDYDSFEDYKVFLDDNYVNNQIRELKALLRQQERNAIRWVELSRLYSIVGHTEKSEKAMSIALGLSNGNRYISRSATRLFCHNDKVEKSLFYLKRQHNTTIDPWLLAAEISANRLIGKTSKNIKKGLQLIHSNNFSSADISELACSIGTEEFLSGNRKESKKLFRQALIRPNDNSVAQIEFLSVIDSNYIFEIDFSLIGNPFEAKATEAFSRNDWSDTLLNSQKWLLDMPFSKRAAIFGSFVASQFADNYELAEQFCVLGLIANPNDVAILNNLSYALVMQNRIEEAIKVLYRIKTTHIFNAEANEVVALGATHGLIKFRQGNAEQGRELYSKAIEYAKKHNFDYYALLAQIHLLNEEITKNDINLSPLIQSTEKLVKRFNYHATNILWHKILNKLRPNSIVLKI